MAVTKQDLLDPAYLESLNDFQLMSRVAVDGFMAGIHRSHSHGAGMEFLQYRNYSPGEDLKYLDWKVLAKSDKLYTKVFQEETNMNCYFVLDTSASMQYQGSRAACSKLHYACMVAACIAQSASRQGDNVGLFAYSDHLHESVEIGGRLGQVDHILRALTRLKPTGEAQHESMLQTFLRHFKSRGTVIYISDMLEGEDVLPKLLRNFRVNKSDCLAIQVLDPDELDLPQNRVTRYLDSELESEVTTYPETARADYEKRMGAFLERLKEGLAQSQVDFIQLVTTDSVGVSLAKYFDHRGPR
ncbi:MAG: DUF58 domain-containing protein [Opitutales bacterium]|mgnify:CR=1 FL=1|jgi:uncharacterized protein (DUF58 family)|nr:DUF58 domain-containing protein [Opitutales bacterium]